MTSAYEDADEDDIIEPDEAMIAGKIQISSPICVS